MYRDFIEDRINVFLQEFEKLVVKENIPVTNFLYKECDYKLDNILPEIDDSFTLFTPYLNRWGGKKDKHAKQGKCTGGMPRRKTMRTMKTNAFHQMQILQYLAENHFRTRTYRPNDMFADLCTQGRQSGGQCAHDGHTPRTETHQ